MTKRYARQMVLPEVGTGGQQKLALASVLVVGAGGLGCPVLSYLAGAGVGHISIVDHDRVDFSNLHRQPLYGEADVGLMKAEAAAAILRKFNSDCVVESVASRLTPVNADGLVANASVIVDAADSLAVTYMLSDTAMALGKPLVSASVIGFQGYAGVFCGGAPSYRAVFPDMPEQAANCATAGVIGSAVGVLGSLQAHMVLQLLLGLEPSPLGRLISVDFRTLSFGGFSFLGAPEPEEAGLRFLDTSAIAVTDLVVDLRGSEEAPVPVTPNAVRLAAGEIAQLQERASAAERTVLCCRSGLRAWRAGRELRGMGVRNISLIAVGG